MLGFHGGQRAQYQGKSAILFYRKKLNNGMANWFTLCDKLNNGIVNWFTLCDELNNGLAKSLLEYCVWECVWHSGRIE